MDGPVLVTGGAGYLGAHVVAELASGGATPVVLDDLSTGSPAVLRALERLAGVRILCIEGDVRDRMALRRAFAEHPFAAVVHCAGLADPDDAQARPLACWDVNVGGTVALAEVAGEAGVATVVLSSTAAVYGDAGADPVAESAAPAPLDVCGRTYRAAEEFLGDLVRANPNWRIAVLRSFAVAGAHPSGLLGPPAEGAAGLPARLARVAAGDAPQAVIPGDDWPTPDGTNVRDYVHVQDAAAAHVAALRYLASHPGLATFNVGRGKGVSALELVAAFERSCGRAVTKATGPRRPGDVAVLRADARAAASAFDWRPQRDLAAICDDAWRWQKSGAGG